MHTVVFGWFGISVIWFAPLVLRLAMSAFTQGAGARGRGTIRLWLGFVGVFVGSGALEAALAPGTGNALGHALLGVATRTLGRGAFLVLPLLVLASLPWLVGFRWRSVLHWADRAFGLGLNVRPASAASHAAAAAREEEPRVVRGLAASVVRTSTTNTMAPKSAGRYARPTLWQPPPVSGNKARTGGPVAPGVERGAGVRQAEPRTAGRGGMRHAIPPGDDASPPLRTAHFAPNRPNVANVPNVPQRSRSSAPPVARDHSKSTSDVRARVFAEPVKTRPAAGAMGGPVVHVGSNARSPSAAHGVEPLPAASSTPALSAKPSGSRGPAGDLRDAARAQAAHGPRLAPIDAARHTSAASEPPPGVLETLRAIEANAAQWTALAGSSLARRGVAPAPLTPLADTLAPKRDIEEAAAQAPPSPTSLDGATARVDAPSADVQTPAAIEDGSQIARPLAQESADHSIESGKGGPTNLPADDGQAPADEPPAAYQPDHAPGVSPSVAWADDGESPEPRASHDSPTDDLPPWIAPAGADAPPIAEPAAAAHPMAAAPEDAASQSGGMAPDPTPAAAIVSAAPVLLELPSSPNSGFVAAASPALPTPPASPAAIAATPLTVAPNETSSDACAARAPLRGHVGAEFTFHAPAASSVELPALDLLEPASSETEEIPAERLAQTGQLIEQRLQEFKVPVTVVGASAGPVITRFEIEPALGVRGSQIVGLMKDLSRGLGLTSIRVVETIPGKTCMGLELPNAKRQTIRLSEILAADSYRHSASKLTIAMGKDITGHPIVTDLAKAPHMLVAGTTGSGKSVAINAMIVSLLFKATPEEVRLIMIDPKMLELSVYEGIPHLLAPVVTDMKLAANALNWCVGEMEKRYRLMSAVGVRNLAGFNQKLRDAQAAGKKIGNPFSLTPEAPEPLSPLPMIVVVIDELADLMMVAGKKIEELIARLAQKARAAGIHLILATQRPSVDVITGLIKANIPTRVAFQVSSKIDSRTILDQMGAESLLGQGDMLFLPPGTGYPQRVHGAFVADEEVHRVVEHLKQFGEPEYEEGILDGPASEGAAQDLFGDAPDAEADPLYDEAVAFVVRTRRASISAVQRQLRIGYNRAARLVEQMEAAGLVSSMGINGSREVLAPPSSEP